MASYHVYLASSFSSFFFFSFLFLFFFRKAVTHRLHKRKNKKNIFEQMMRGDGIIWTPWFLSSFHFSFCQSILLHFLLASLSLLLNSPSLSLFYSLDSSVVVQYNIERQILETRKIKNANLLELSCLHI